MCSQEIQMYTLIREQKQVFHFLVSTNEERTFKVSSKLPRCSSACLIISSHLHYTFHSKETHRNKDKSIFTA